MVLQNWQPSYNLLFIIWMFLSGTIFSYAQIKLPGLREMYFRTFYRDVTIWQIYRPDNRLFEFRKDGTINEYQLVQKDFQLVEQQIGRNEAGYYKLPDKVEIGDLYRKTAVTDELFIPKPQNSDGQLKQLRCRPSGTGPSSFWRSCGSIINPLFDYELESSRNQYSYVMNEDGYEQFDQKYPNYYSSLPIKVRYNLEPIAQKALAQIPVHFDENGHPESSELRWSFDVIDREISLTNGRIVVKVTYKGDIETHRFLGGCHLRWVYPVAILSFRPSIEQIGTDTIISAKDVEMHVDLRADTDEHCTGILPIYLGDGILQFLNGEEIKRAAISKINEMRAAFPTDIVFHKLNSALVFSNGRGCFYPDVKKLKIGELSGNLTSAELPLVATSTSKLLFSSTFSCREPVSEKPIIKTKIPRSVDKFRVTLGLQLSYQRIGDEVRNYIEKHPDLHITDFNLKFFREGWFLLNAKFTESSGLGNQEFELAPHFDEEQRQIYFQVNPTSEILKGKNEVEKSLIENIAENLDDGLVFDISGDIEKAKQTASGSHKIDDVTVNLVISKIIPFDIVVNYYGIDFYAIAEGDGEALVEIK